MNRHWGISLSKDVFCGWNGWYEKRVVRSAEIGSVKNGEVENGECGK